MNEVGYDYAIPGNHEFDFGMDQFNWFVENSTATYDAVQTAVDNAQAEGADYVKL